MLILAASACASPRSRDLPGVTPAFIPIYNIGKTPQCATKILGREQFLWNRYQHLNHIIAPLVEARGGNAVIELVMDPDRESTEPPTDLSPRYVSFTAAFIDWTDCEPGTRIPK